jgi:hypothetical protein
MGGEKRTASVKHLFQFGKGQGEGEWPSISRRKPPASLCAAWLFRICVVNAVNDLGQSRTSWTTLEPSKGMHASPRLSGKDSLHSLPHTVKQSLRLVRNEERAVACLKKTLTSEWAMKLPGLREK